MDDDSQEDKSSVSRYRSPTFSKEETKYLVNLVSQHRYIIMNKSSNAMACVAKDSAWVTIAKSFNSQGFEFERSALCLKRKWENIKKDIRRTTKNFEGGGLLDNDLSEVNAQVVSILSEESNVDVDFDNMDIGETYTLKKRTNEKKAKIEEEEYEGKYNECNDDEVQKQSDNSDADEGNESGEKSSRINRSLNFSIKESNLLMQCVKKEKEHVFSKCITSRAIKLKNQAWNRITNSYNKLSPQKRSTKVLRTKFSNMKNMAKRVAVKDYFGQKHKKLIDENAMKIKKEPDFSFKMGNDSDDDHSDLVPNNGHQSFVNYIGESSDPLSSVLNGDSGIGIGSSNTGSVNQFEDKEVVKLKLELLNYQMETAKLERKRVEESIKQDQIANEARATETAIRLRTARLDLVAAEARLPNQHPALAPLPPEELAIRYCNTYQMT